MPRAILRGRHTNGTVAVAFTLSSEVKYIRYKHLRNALLVLIDILCSVQPCNSCTDRCLQLTDSKRKSINQENDVQTFSAFLLRIHPLIRNNILVLIQFAIDLGSEEVDRYLLTIFAKRI